MRAADRRFFNERKINIGPILGHPDRANLTHKGLNINTLCGQQQFRDRTGRNTRRRFPRTGPAAAPMVAVAKFSLPRKIRMAGPERRFDMIIIAAALILVWDQERDGCAERFALKKAAQDLHRVRFLALGDDMALAGPPPVEFLLDKINGNRQPSRTTIDHNPNSCAVALAEGGNAEKVAKTVHRAAKIDGIAAKNILIVIMLLAIMNGSPENG